MASRFASISDEEVKEFTEKLENENTKKKTLYDLKVFKEYLDACDEKRKIEDIRPVELQEIIKKIVLAVRKKNSEEYEPSSLRAFIQSIDRHLRKNKYGFSVLNDKEFHEVQDILKKKQKQLKSIGKGNRPNAADPLSDEDIDTFYSGKVLGIHSPSALNINYWLGWTKDWPALTPPPLPVFGLSVKAYCLVHVKSRHLSKIYFFSYL